MQQIKKKRKERIMPFAPHCLPCFFLYLSFSLLLFSKGLIASLLMFPRYLPFLLLQF